MISIKSTNNKKIKEYLFVSKSKKIRKEKGLCVLEGLRLITDAFQFGVTFKQIFISEETLKKLEAIKSPLLSFRPIATLNKTLAKKLSLVQNSQNIFAIVKKPENAKFNELRNDQKILVLIELNDPGNVGTLIRSAAAFDFTTIILANCCDVYNPKLIRSSMSCLFKTKILECSINEFKNWLNRTTNLQTIASLPSVNKWQKKCSYNSINGCVLLVGNEANGLPDELSKLCRFQATLTMQPFVESLNAAVAGSVLMFELSQNKLCLFET